MPSSSFLLSPSPPLHFRSVSCFLFLSSICFFVLKAIFQKKMDALCFISLPEAHSESETGGMVHDELRQRTCSSMFSAALLSPSPPCDLPQLDIWTTSPSKPTSSRSPCFCLSCLLGDPSQEVIFSTELLSSLGHLYLPVLQEVNLLLQSFIHLKWLLWCQHTGPLGALAQPRCSANQGAAACTHSIRPCCTKQLFLPLKNILFALRLQLTQTSILIYSCATNIIALENS